MAKHTNSVHCIDFNAEGEVKMFLSYLRSNGAKIVAFDQKKPSFNTFAIITRYREKVEKKK